MRFTFIRGAFLLSVVALLSLGPAGTCAGFPDPGKEAEKNDDGDIGSRRLDPGGNNGNGAANKDKKKNYDEGPPPGAANDEIGVIVKWKDEKVSSDRSFTITNTCMSCWSTCIYLLGPL